MNIQLNNNTIQINRPITVQELVNRHHVSSKGIAIAINNNVIPRLYWHETKIKENDNIIIITATQGG